MLVNAIIFSDIGILREDPLSMGILDVFFLKISDHSSLKLREFIYLKIAQIFISTTRTIRIEVGSSIPYIAWNLGSFFFLY
jgi:hypothetical protein